MILFNNLKFVKFAKHKQYEQITAKPTYIFAELGTNI